MSPNSGKTAVGTRVTITGANFSHVTAVHFGTTSGSSIKVGSTRSLTVTAPKHAAGRVDIRVVTTAGTSAAGAADRYTYVAAPVVTGIAPAVGHSGARVTVTGANFNHVTAVKFGTITAPSLVVVSSTKLLISAAAHPSGPVDVRVTTAYGTSPLSLKDRYTYDTTPPGPVTGLTAIPTASTVGLKWTNPTAPDFTGVKICSAYGPVAPTSNCTAVKNLAKAATTFADTGLTELTQYTYAVFAHDAVSNYAVAAAVTTTTPAIDPTPPGPVTLVTATAMSPTSIGLSWANPSDSDFAGTRICRATGATAPTSSSCPAITTITSPTATFTDSGLSAGTQYSYALFAQDGVPNYASPVAAHATTPGFTSPGGIAGTIQDTSGHGLAKAVVQVTDSLGAALPAVLTATDGTYTVAGLVGATLYSICFTGRSATGGSSTLGYQSQCYDHQNPARAAANFTAVPGQTVHGIDATLVGAAGLGGRLTDSSGHPLGHVTVTGTAGGASTQSALDGTYLLTGLSGGSVAVCFDATTATGGPAVAYLDLCTTKSLVAGRTTTLDEILSDAAAVVGTVTDRAGRHLGNAAVAVYQDFSNPPLGTGTSSSDGAYQFRLNSRFDPAQTTNVCVLYSNGITGGVVSGYEQGCVKVTLHSGLTVTANIVLAPRGRIIGTVTDASGHPLANVHVSATARAGAGNWYGDTDASGKYAVNVSAQYYTVCFDGSSATGGTDANGYLFAQCYQGAPADGSAPNLSVDDGQLVTIDIVLVAAAKVSGTVTDGAGHGLAGVLVKVDAPIGGSGKGVAADITAANGSYALTALAPGKHTVCFDTSNATGGASTTGYLPQCYNAVAAGGAPTQLTLTPGQSAVVNVSLAPGGSISGKILDSAGKATPVPAQAYVRTTQDEAVTTGVAAADGTYRVNGLAPGTYYVEFSDVPANGEDPSIHVPQRWNAAALRHTPTAVVVTAGHVTAGIDAALQNYEPIVGKVTDSAGNPLKGVQVEADYTDDGSQASAVVSKPDGTYALTSFMGPGVAPDSYTVHYHVTNATGGASTTGYGDQVRSATVLDGQPKTLNVTMPTGGSITGTLTDSGGNPIEVGELVVSQSGQVFADVVTSVDGTYTAGPLAPGGYTVCVTNAYGGTFTGYTPQCYNNVAPGGTPTTVTVTSGHTTANVNAVLKGPGTISGTVTDAAGSPLAGVAVFAQISGGQSPLRVNTDVDGTYSFTSTALAGAYAVCFDAEAQSSGSAVNGYVDQCYNGIAPNGTPTPVVVTAEHATVNINARLAAAGAPQVAISGTVTDAGGHAISGVGVAISPVGSFDPPGSATTTALGTYSVTNLIPGQYSVCFSYPPTDNPDGSQTAVYEDQCYLNQAWGGPVTPVVVAAGHTTTGINATLLAFGSIGGQVTDGAGRPLAGVTVAITPTDPSIPFGGGGQTDASGHYLALTLLPGSYTVCFTADISATTGGPGDALGYIPQCYLSVTAGGTGTPVIVGGGGAVSGINTKLATYGGVSGTVTDSQGHALSNVQVFASDSSQVGIGSVVTDASGHYSIPGLEAGSISICFGVDGAPSGGSFDALGYVAQCYNGVATGGTPTNITITRGLSTPNVNAALAAFGGLSGTVKDSAAHPLSGVEVLVTNTGTGVVVHDEESTDANGRYTINGLASGSYTVCFAVNDRNGSGGPSDAFGYVGQCYNGVANGGTPTTAAVVSGATTTNLNATLAAFGGISGKVTDAAGHPLAKVTVTTVQAEDHPVVTDATGTYKVSQLVPGSYQLCFTPSASGGPAAGGPSDPYGYQPQCYNGVAPGSPATTVPVAGGATTALVATELVAYGTISGTVTDSTGTHLSGVHVSVSPTGTAANDIDTDLTGGYSIAGVVPGSTYTVCYDAANVQTGSALGYLDRCFSNIAPGGGPTAVVVTAGNTTVVNQSLPIAGAVSGTVSDLHGAVANVRIWAIATSTGAVAYTTTSGPTGTYTITGLAAGSYHVCFYAATDAATVTGVQAYFDQCYNNVAPGGAPTPVAVSSAARTTGVNATLKQVPASG